ncbi:MAG: hypothetical protein GWP14_07820 [Actinobacteria bacterium]|nr:hypothetical protein [Actinomycetota bacterium]
MTSKRFVIGDVLGFGWQVMKANLWFFVGVGIVGGMLNILPNIITQIVAHIRSPKPELFLVILPVFIIATLISIVISIGFVKIALSFCDTRKPTFGTLFDFHGCFWRYVGVLVLYILILYAGFLLFIIPGIIWAVKYSLCTYFVVDKGLGPVQALKASSRTTMGVKWQLLGFGILCALINYLGLLCLVVGIFATYPTVLVARALVYRHLLAQTPELAEFGIDTSYSQATQDT